MKQLREINVTSKKRAGQRKPVTVRLSSELLDQIDAALEQRMVPISRNNWLLEAAIEKLERTTERGGHGTK